MRPSQLPAAVLTALASLGPAAAVAACLGAATLGASLASAREASAAPPAYVGAAACGACHPAAEQAWAASAHARASSSDVLGRRARDAACLACHATGEGGDRARLLAGVQCEACHGAGAAYAAADDIMRDRPLARALGLRDLSKDPAAVCVRCHRDDGGTRAAKFDYASAWKQIEHR